TYDNTNVRNIRAKGERPYYGLSPYLVRLHRFRLVVDSHDAVDEAARRCVNGYRVPDALAEQAAPQRRLVADFAEARVGFCRADDMEPLRLGAFLLHGDDAVQPRTVGGAVMPVPVDDAGPPQQQFKL